MRIGVGGDRLVKEQESRLNELEKEFRERDCEE